MRCARLRLGVLRWYAAARGYRIYALALVLAVPDILDALAGVDFTVLLPRGWKRSRLRSSQSCASCWAL
ncbi:hypothetical protein [Methylobacterium sp. P5_C11]